jgi:glutamyl-tRNA synthetase
VIVRTRFAPSPTGDLHLGGAWTALASWAVARRAGGATALRLEDLDRPRLVRGSQARIEEDLRWLGLVWDEGPVPQSERGPIYREALSRLAAKGLLYPCDCSRAEIARVASAPHPSEETVYPGRCRDRDPRRTMKRPPALRARIAHETLAYEDAAVGRVVQNLARDAGDFVLKRGDGVFAYHFAVVVDDVAMGITDVVRGADLVASTPRQIWLARALGALPPRYTHVPLVVGSDGARLEKRTRGATVRELRQAGVSAERILGALAHGLGLAATLAPAGAAEIARGCAGRAIPWRRDPWPIPASW